MSWICYEAYLEAKAPIHIGYGAKLGIVARTRYYIPAKNIWGAITNLITKTIMRCYDLKLYQKVGMFLNENIKFSYFYPIEYEKTNERIEVQQVFAPYYDKDSLKFGVCKNKQKISVEEFEQRFISAFISTSMEKTSKSAEEGSLHEIEFIRDKSGYSTRVKPTIFVGYFFIRDNPLRIEINSNEIEIQFTNFIEINDIKLKEIWVGGERNYGFGRVKLYIKELKKDEIDLFNSGMIANIADDLITIDNQDKEKIALSHISILTSEGINLIRGDIEPVLGREWNEKGAGQKLSSEVKICITPGSVFATENKIICIQDF